MERFTAGNFTPSSDHSVDERRVSRFFDSINQIIMYNLHSAHNSMWLLEFCKEFMERVKAGNFRPSSHHGANAGINEVCMVEGGGVVGYTETFDSSSGRTIRLSSTPSLM